MDGQAVPGGVAAAKPRRAGCWLAVAAACGIVFMLACTEIGYVRQVDLYPTFGGTMDPISKVYIHSDSRSKVRMVERSRLLLFIEMERRTELFTPSPLAPQTQITALPFRKWGSPFPFLGPSRVLSIARC